MALLQRPGSGVWHYSIYIPGANKRLRGSTGTKSRVEAEAVEKLLRASIGGATPRKRLLRMIDALYPPEEDEADVPLCIIPAELARASEIIRKPVSEKTRRDRQSNIERFQAWCRRSAPEVTTMRGVDRRCAQAYAAHLARQGLSSKSIANIVGILGAAWNLLRRIHDGVTNPWPLAMPGEVVRNRREAFSPDEVQRLFRAADEIGHGWGLACRIAAATGLRFGDIVRLDHSDVRGGVVYATPNKTRHSSAVSVAVPLPPDLARVIGNGVGPLLPEMRAEYERLGCYLTCPFTQVMALAGVPPRGRTFHSFRHFFRTQLSRAGVSDEIAMKLGGWTQRSTADRYDHDGRSAEKSAAVAAAWALLGDQAAKRGEQTGELGPKAQHSAD